ncbi:MAG: DUF1552 domain-containing protein [Myxococcota bacterium]
MKPPRSRNPAYRHVLSRRTLLRGAGGIAIGLPFLSEMRAASVFAADPPPPPRVLTFFFGLGVPSEYQRAGFESPHLAPLARVADKIALVRGVHYEKGSRSTGNHGRGSETAFVGGHRTGASIDQRVRTSLPGGSAPTRIQTLVAGSFSRQSDNSRHIHSWSGRAVPTDAPIEDPKQLFDRTFGSLPTDPSSDMPTEAERERARRARYERSVLDSALEQYRYVTSDAFGLSEESKAKVALHVERIRELELGIFDPDAEVASPMGCVAEDPGRFDHPEMVEIQRTVNNEGVRMEVNRWMRLWRSMVDVYVLAFQCDLCRFGNLQLTSGGERIRLYGSYSAYGQTRAFDDAETTHEYWHRLAPGPVEALMLDHVWLYAAEMAHLFERLDDTVVDENGGTLLENALVWAATELGNGRSHDVEDVFHLVSRTNGRLRTGVIDVDRQATEVYNASLRALGLGLNMEGDRDVEGSVADELLT